MNTTLMKRLARRQGLARRFAIEYVDDAWPFLRVHGSVGVARVIGEAKREAQPDGRVFIRGQIENHNAMRPSLFRGPSGDWERIRSAEAEFRKKLAERINVRRFQAPNVSSLLQHYGYRTSWLDVVDNLFVAYWFAGHRVSEGANGSLQICESGAAMGWLFLVRPPASALVVDLRAQHHPLSARPHVQHGVSVTCEHSSWPDFHDWIVATIQTPVSGSVGGSLFAAPALFPPASADHTLKLLLKHEANELAAEIEAMHRLPEYALGRTSQLSGAA